MIASAGRTRTAAAGALLAAALLCGEAHAWAWPMAKGEGQAILKYERQAASDSFGHLGLAAPDSAEEEEMVSLWVERGVTGRLTVQGKFGWVRGETLEGAFEGRGPTELGLRYAFIHRPSMVFSVYAGASMPGEGRDGRFVPDQDAGADREVRLLFGRSSKFLDRPAFSELQLARIEREHLPSETRFDTTFGWRPSPPWLLMVQTYSGEAHTPQVQHLWLNGEVSVVRDVAGWKLQGGWRSTIAGMNAPRNDGPVLAVWRSF